MYPSKSQHEARIHILIQLLTFRSDGTLSIQPCSLDYLHQSFVVRSGKLQYKPAIHPWTKMLICDSEETPAAHGIPVPPSLLRELHDEAHAMKALPASTFLSFSFVSYQITLRSH